jgi:23S rRNA (cytidine2498-2'-O)-methyltransferase
VTDYVFATCLPRSAAYLKRELARSRPDLRPAYMRPGLITMRTDAPPEGLADHPEPRAAFARTSGRSLGPADSLDKIEALAQTLDAPRLRLHVYARDPVDPDRDPEDHETTARWRADIGARLGARVLEGSDDAEIGDTVLDVVLPQAGLTDPMFVGWHVHDEWRGSAPGGVRRVPVPDDVPSRAYAKLEEALAWSRLPLIEGDTVVEIGSSPGGAAMSLLRRGAHVIGIDPSRMDPRVLGWRGTTGTFRHLGILAERVRTRDLPSVVDWLVLDANVAPHRALVALRQLVTLRTESIRGLLLTLKINDAGIVDDLPVLLEQIRELSGASSLRFTQLPSAHQEVVVWAPREPAPS